MSIWRDRVEEEATKIAHEAARPVLRSMYPSRSRGQMANEFKHFYISGAELERARAEKLVTALEHIQGMAGNPDASEGCRNIIKRAQEALKEYEARR